MRDGAAATCAVTTLAANPTIKSKTIGDLFAAIIALFKRKHAVKVDNTELLTEIDAAAVNVTGLLTKLKDSVAEAGKVVDLQAQLAAANDANAALTADLAASQADSANAAEKLKAINAVVTAQAA